MLENTDVSAADRIAKNLLLTKRLLDEIVENPDILDEIPEGVMVFLLPEDDSELAEQNRQGAQKAVEAGHRVYVRATRSATHPRTPRSIDT